MEWSLLWSYLNTDSWRAVEKFFSDFVVVSYGLAISSMDAEINIKTSYGNLLCILRRNDIVAIILDINYNRWDLSIFTARYFSGRLFFSNQHQQVSQELKNPSIIADWVSSWDFTMSVVLKSIWQLNKQLSISQIIWVFLFISFLFIRVDM